MEKIFDKMFIGVQLDVPSIYRGYSVQGFRLTLSWYRRCILFSISIFTFLKSF